MVVGKFPFESPNIITLFTNIARGKFTIPEWVGPELTDLLKGVLQVDPDNRLSLQQIRKHNWMKNAIKESSSNIPIDTMPSLFGNDSKTLNQILEDLQKRNSESMCGTNNHIEDYTDTNTDHSELTYDDSLASSISEDKPETLQKKPALKPIKSFLKDKSGSDKQHTKHRRSKSDRISRRVSIPVGVKHKVT